MTDAAVDPYSVLGLTPDASDADLRRTYRELVKRHHPDHNGGSAESTARFAQIQNAYAVVAEWRRNPRANQREREASTGKRRAAADPGVDDRIANLERELAARRREEQRRAEQQARIAREQARQAAAERAAAGMSAAQTAKPTPEELGYYTTDDSFTKIIDDAAEEFADRVRGSSAKRQFARRLADLFGRGD